MKKMNIVYIAGCVRSGSTLFDVMLANHPEVISIGELSQLGENIHSEKGVCLCGKHLSKCPFWKNIEKESRLDFSRIKTKLIKNVFTKFLVFLSPYGRATLMGLDFIPSIRQNRRSANNIFTLYETVARVTGKRIIIDSSKGAMTFKYYYLHSPQQVKIIFLYRDGRGVMNSLIKRGQRPDDAARSWINSVRNMEMMGLMIPNSKIFKLKYEELCHDPEQTMKDVCDFIGVEYTPVITSLDKSMKHNIGGSPTIKRQENKKINVVYDNSWENELTPAQLEIFRKIAGKTNQRLGFAS